ncbi:Leucyltransferase [Psychromonas ingrahamii 37]|uniref:Leucyl/phenylalanyl-tRNA--protein transferase n=1 Tax=Psychromonas ingrahamii (strain DSM 17664 / CCUG 51855 / 37) TaxID=357804 RepID=LFTR_PSYIN|nr:leucyl/phenylalanyl-tRNA--protein transferase [Psychromonas ingrahamii]A1SWY4.1 RecName: Full=Leucyl/phenylalanyl-tRNA--protein transferase; AltName: Full=L/F-transferase; AltName: Full=Leucyltransferase; AltName: Full=Phenyalanyltransferase [Psychromonas ingrahamii 37]ABM03999.1 Leucyltransferase [Psychromonas ingrahamii 37]
MTLYIPELPINNTIFPDTSLALSDPDGLLAMGGDLSPQRIIKAYQQGIFPWFSDGQPILWWSPSQRAIIQPNLVHISSSMKKIISKNNFSLSINHAFHDVIDACAAPRGNQNETWITFDMIAAYQKLHQQGIAHSIEVWRDNKLVGGLYGVCIGSVFCGESMFSKEDNTSKIAFIALCQHFDKFKGQLIDCQILTKHLQSFGVQNESRDNFINYLNQYKNININKKCWDKQTIFIKNR